MVSKRTIRPDSVVVTSPAFIVVAPPLHQKETQTLERRLPRLRIGRGVEKGQSCDDRGNYEYDFLVFIHVGSAYPLLSQIAKDHFLR